MKVVAILLLFFLSGCVSREVRIEASYQEMTNDMASLNTRLRGKIYRKSKDLSILNNSNYVILAREIADPSEREYVQFFDDEKPPFEVVSNKTHFAICFRMKSIMRVVCDVTTTAFPDDKGIEYDIDLKEKALVLLNGGE